MGRREEILEAAREAFVKYGLTKITLEDIANECGLKKTALYYYFKNKDEILAEMISHIITEMQEIVKVKASEAETARAKLKIFMSTKLALMQKNANLINLFENERLSLPAREFMKEREKCLNNFDFDFIREILLMGKENHKLTHQVTDSLVLMVMGVIYGSFFGKMFEGADWDLDAMIDTTIEVIFSGIENPANNLNNNI